MSKIARGSVLTEIQAEVGRRMAWARELVEPNRTVFATLIGCDPSTLAKIEAGDRAPSIFVVRDYAHRLKMTADFFLFGHLGDGNDRELERKLIAHHPELVLDRPQHNGDATAKAPLRDTFLMPKKPDHPRV